MHVSLVNILIAFAGGLLSFLSPCVLPLVPGYISLMSGVSIDHLKGGGGSRTTARRAVILNSIAFNAGTHRDAIVMRWADFVKMVNPVVGKFAEPPLDRVAAYRWSHRK